MVRGELEPAGAACWAGCRELRGSSRGAQVFGQRKPWFTSLPAFFPVFESMHCWKSGYQSKTNCPASRRRPCGPTAPRLARRWRNRPGSVGWDRTARVLHHYSEMVFKMLKMSFIMEMEKYWCDMLGIVACACICLAERWGKFSVPSC